LVVFFFFFFLVFFILKHFWGRILDPPWGVPFAWRPGVLRIFFFFFF